MPENLLRLPAGKAGKFSTDNMRPEATLSASLVLPVYNGERYLAATLQTLLEFLTAKRSIELVVVDDGSLDATATIVRDCAGRSPQIRLLQHAGNRGKGAAVRTGVLASGGDVIGFCDADLPMPVEEIEALFRRIEQGASVAIASRALSGSVLVEPPSAMRRLLSRGFNRMVRALFALPFEDTQCGLKGFQRDVARAIFSHTHIDGFAFDVEVLLLAQQLGYAVDEMPVRIDNPRRSSVRLETHAGTIWNDLWRIRRQHDHQSRFATSDIIRKTPVDSPDDEMKGEREDA